jgi:hypothetical protein
MPSERFMRHLKLCRFLSRVISREPTKLVYAPLRYWPTEGRKIRGASSMSFALPRAVGSVAFKRPTLRYTLAKLVSRFIIVSE